MRKDAKIGFAIGGVLLAVLTVYMIVVPRKHHAASPQAVSLALPKTTGQSEAITPPAESSTPPTPQPESAPEPKATETASASKNDGVNWEKLFPGAHDVATQISSTPSGLVPAVDSGKQSDMPLASAAPGSTPRSASARGSSGTGFTSVASSASTQPASTHQYVVKSGQTLSSIAAEQYGNSRFYVAIMRANPSVNPNMLRPGMKIILPPSSEVKPEASAAVASRETSPTEAPALMASATEGAAGGGVVTSGQPVDVSYESSGTSSHGLDDSSTYTVKPGDTLYRIAKKLYGSGRQAKLLYQLNKETIGPDESKLKLGMILRLPDSPMATATAAAR